MGCKCGSQVILCNLPVRFDTYRGCSHGCRYCFARKKNEDLEHIQRDESVDSLRAFIEGKRGAETAWCDWNIPIHWGGMSDPFQPVEKKVRASYECLELLAATKYPFVVSTKGRLVADPEYLDLLAKCNCVVQISMVCSKYDKLERGCPSYEERLAMLKTVSGRVQRTVARIQPYMPEVFKDVMQNIPRVAAAGAYGVVVEGMKFYKGKPGMVKVGGDHVYPLDILRRQFTDIKAECHRHGLVFLSGENRLRAMGDSMTCCGTEGLEGFRPNEYNLCMIMNGKNPQPTERMKQVGTGGPFKTLNQSAGSGRRIAKQSFYGLMQEELATKTEYHRKVFGLEE
ncbi:radical SAM protein [Faecalispora jeddahensis]|uniref:radical SAM protein n=1 Tax=Faecalispora jeddahensis TaxID=1414721 RepID=UPI0027B8C443|nr:radical SAM protein [Faecalispora jeddahensis]